MNTSTFLRLVSLKYSVGIFPLISLADYSISFGRLPKDLMNRSMNIISELFCNESIVELVAKE